MERSHRASGLPIRLWHRAAVLATALVAFSLVLPLTSGDAQPGAPQPSFNELVAQARLLAHQIDSLSQQYDGLRVRLSETRNAAKAAGQTAARDSMALAGGVQRVSQIAAESYVTGGYDPTLSLATSSDPQGFIDRASIMAHLQSENGAVLHSLQTAQAAASRAQATAQQQSRQVASLVKQMGAQRNLIQSKINLIESSAYKKALEIASQTGTFPVAAPVGDSLGARALRYALTVQGDPYVWGAAGPATFDCSGLVMWAYEQIGIQLPHYTGYQWTSGVHISRSQLQAGDLVFFYSDLGHVGLYIGNGLMIDAPNFGESVHVEPVYWGVYVGAVRIAI
ncbi:MAG TPA: NlpC/P60 family protein [Streptosporangiaceae bacterium]|nr:NlpC/P60 family protein [Streptosporangiaceae bacterium]